MIEVRHLKLISTIAQVGSLNKAADKLCLTQSALSHQLKELESRLGVQIFHRIHNQLHFTPEGKELNEASKAILFQFENLENRVRKMGQDKLKSYVHGYSEQESKRLNNQAKTMAELLHYDSLWEDNATILEVGCGVGSQTKIICPKNQNCQFVSIDHSEKSLVHARKTVKTLGIDNVKFVQADLFDLPFEDEYFDHIFVCFVLEHLDEPEAAIKKMLRVLKKKGTITVIEGDHGSTYFYPDSVAAKKAIQAQVQLQVKNGGNANIGRQLFPLLSNNGCSNVMVDPRQVYVDASKPEMVEGFIKNTFTAMIQGIKEEAIAKKIIAKNTIEEGIRDLYKTMEGGTFCYTFFKAVAMKP